MHCDRMRAWRTQPACGQPGLGNEKLRPSTIQTDPNVGRRGHRRMAHGAGDISIKTNLCRHDRDRAGLALRTKHVHLMKQMTQGEAKTSVVRESQHYLIGRDFHKRNLKDQCALIVKLLWFGPFVSYSGLAFCKMKHSGGQLTIAKS